MAQRRRVRTLMARNQARQDSNQKPSEYCLVYLIWSQIQAKKMIINNLEGLTIHNSADNNKRSLSPPYYFFLAASHCLSWRDMNSNTTENVNGMQITRITKKNPSPWTKTHHLWNKALVQCSDPFFLCN